MNACVDCGVPVRRSSKQCRTCFEGTSLTRFWAKVDLNGPLWDGTPCWLWSGYLGDGYGQIYVEGRILLAHRFSYETYVGAIPEGLDIDHLCRNRPCVNWAHLEPVTRQVNLLRGTTLAALNAAKTHCPQGHAYDERDIYGKRPCRKCASAREKLRDRRSYMKEWRANKKLVAA